MDFTYSSSEHLSLTTICNKIYSIFYFVVNHIIYIRISKNSDITYNYMKLIKLISTHKFPTKLIVSAIYISKFQKKIGRKSYLRNTLTFDQNFILLFYSMCVCIYIYIYIYIYSLLQN